MVRTIFTIISISLASLIYAQKQTLTLEKAITGGRDLAPSSWSSIQWSNIDNTLFYSTQGNYIYTYNPAKNTTDSVNLLSAVNPALKASGVEELKSIPAFTLGKNNEFIFRSGDQKLSFDLKKNSLTKLSGGPKHADFSEESPSGHVFAYTAQQALWIQKADGQSVKVAQGNDSIVYGESVHRQEFGIEKGIFWSPKGNKLAFYRMDQSMVTRYPVMDLSKRPATDQYIYYPMAGARSHHVTVGIYDITSGTTIYLETGGDLEHYLTNICWSPDEKEIYIAEINRDQNHTLFNAYNPDRGNRIRTLYEEQSRQYTEPLVPYTFIPGQNSLMIAQSKRDGWNTLYLYTNEGELIRQLTREVEVTDIIGFDNKNKFVYFQAIEPNSIDLQYYRSEIATGKMTRYTGSPGLHTARISFDGAYAFESNNVFGQKISYVCRDLKKNRSNLLMTASEPLEQYNLGETRLDTLYSGDGTKLFARTIFPYDFDPAGKYPVVIYVYGGPHAQMIRNSRLAQAQLWMYTLANEGFIVFTIDNRGSSNRGMRFENGIHRNLGELEIADQMTGYEFIKNRSYVDPARIGVHGWSYGGFMTISLMTRQSGKFYAAVAGGPVTDWAMYEVMYTERYMDTPQDNPEGYKRSSTFNYIDQLSGPMLLIHGTSDDVVIWQQSLSYIEACVKQGKQVDYFVYPGHKHNVLGKDRVHLIRKVIDYFKHNL